jgi:nucleoid-associated protein YgaU
MLHDPEHTLVQGGAPRTYTVQPGDSLAQIAKQFYDNPDDSQKILTANKDRISDPDKLLPGEVLVIPW